MYNSKINENFGKFKICHFLDFDEKNSSYLIQYWITVFSTKNKKLGVYWICLVIHQNVENRISTQKNARKYDWTEYFGNTAKVDKTRIKEAFSDETSSNNYYIFICLFESCKEKGAIYIQRSNNICTLLEDSVFNNCKSSVGGSVYYECLKSGQIVQHRTCYYQSIAETDDMAFHQLGAYSDSMKNYIYDVSVSNCGESESKGLVIFSVFEGDIRISNINSTNNKCNQ